MAQNFPKITVITPTYNRASLICETIESVLRQEYGNFEYLILDDGSTDQTESVVKPYLKDIRVKYLRQANAGEAETVNWGWSLAKGEYFTQVNSDDPILPGLFSEMVSAFEKKKEVVVCYPDFYFIDEKGKIIKKDKTPDWNFLEALSAYSCYAASAGTFIRRSAFQDWKKIKDARYHYISDVEMYWKMALRGDFFHVSKFLATWRVHGDGISAERYKSISEIQQQFEEYFSQKNLPISVRQCEQRAQNSLYNYCLSLINQSDPDKKQELLCEFKDKFFRSKFLQISDNDLIGNKFNGHDLHLYLQQQGVNAKQLVWNKESKDPNTFQIARDREDRNEIFHFVQKIQKKYSLDSLLNPIAYDILSDPLFLNTDLVHLHLIHNNVFDIQLLPLMSRLKPIVWTLHDPWALGGHCIHHFDCEKWKTQCGDCPYLKSQFSLETDWSALNFSLKKDAIQNSNIEIVVASKWMEEKVKQSPIFKGKNIHVIPFGINQEIFRPIEKSVAREMLGVRGDDLVICFRCDPSEFKGLDIVEYVLKNIRSEQKITLLVLANKLRENPRKFDVKEYGWIKDDQLLAKIYSAADIFLMPSKVESFGMMAIEAMSCETLPIVMDGTALPDTVHSLECGISIKRNREAYLKAVQYYIDNPKERCIRAKKCLRFAEINYSKDVYLERILALYRQISDNHVISSSDQQLLDQLRRHSVVVSTSSHFRPNHFYMRDKLRHYSILIFLRYKNIFHKKMRVAVRKIVGI